MKILVAGDFCPHGRVVGSIQKEDYSFFEEVKGLVAGCDYSIVNLESPLIEDDLCKAIPKCGPALKGPVKTIQSLKYVGFNAVTLANNHFRDYGSEGVTSTIGLLDEAGIMHMGGGEVLKKQVGMCI